MAEADAFNIIHYWYLTLVRITTSNIFPKLKKIYHNYNHQSFFYLTKNKPRNSCHSCTVCITATQCPLYNKHSHQLLYIYTHQYQLSGYLPISVIMYKPCSMCRILYCHNDNVKCYFSLHLRTYILCEFFNQIISY